MENLIQCKGRIERRPHGCRPVVGTNAKMPIMRDSGRFVTAGGSAACRPGDRRPSMREVPDHEVLRIVD